MVVYGSVMLAVVGSKHGYFFIYFLLRCFLLFSILVSIFFLIWIGDKVQVRASISYIFIYKDFILLMKTTIEFYRFKLVSTYPNNRGFS